MNECASLRVGGPAAAPAVVIREVNLQVLHGAASLTLRGTAHLDLRGHLDV